MVEGSAKKSSSLVIVDEEKPVLKSKRIRFLIIFAGVCICRWRLGGEGERVYKTNPSRYAAISYI